MKSKRRTTVRRYRIIQTPDTDHYVSYVKWRDPLIMFHPKLDSRHRGPGFHAWVNVLRGGADAFVTGCPRLTTRDNDVHNYMN
jgi:hypothetical protein